MADKAIVTYYTTGGNQLCVECADGSLLFVTVSQLGADITYAPDSKHYPEPMVIDDKGRERYPTSFTRHTD